MDDAVRLKAMRNAYENFKIDLLFWEQIPIFFRGVFSCFGRKHFCFHDADFNFFSYCLPTGKFIPFMTYDMCFMHCWIRFNDILMQISCHDHQHKWSVKEQSENLHISRNVYLGYVHGYVEPLTENKSQNEEIRAFWIGHRSFFCLTSVNSGRIHANYVVHFI